MKTTDISIIIPCYNTEAGYLQDAVNSVLAYNGSYSYEIIMVDDGSTHADTIYSLEALSKQEKIKVFFQPHRGGPAARNYAVKNCSGEYLLLLDSDNKIRPGYIDAGIQALAANPAAGVAYGKPSFFGDTNRDYFTPGYFNIEKLLAENYIDVCAILRKKAWEEVNGMDESLNCYEDWELWIHIFKKGWEFVFLDETLFDYRVRAGSVMSDIASDKFAKATIFIFKKHSDVLYAAYQTLYAEKFA